MNIKTIIIILVLAVVISSALKSLWKSLKGEGGCSCASGDNCCSKNTKASSCGCHKK